MAVTIENVVKISAKLDRIAAKLKGDVPIKKRAPVKAPKTANPRSVNRGDAKVRPPVTFTVVEAYHVSHSNLTGNKPTVATSIRSFFPVLDPKPLTRPGASYQLSVEAAPKLLPRPGGCYPPSIEAAPTPMTHFYTKTQQQSQLIEVAPTPMTILYTKTQQQPQPQPRVLTLLICEKAMLSRIEDLKSKLSTKGLEYLSDSKNVTAEIRRINETLSLGTFQDPSLAREVRTLMEMLTNLHPQAFRLEPESEPDSCWGLARRLGL